MLESMRFASGNIYVLIKRWVSNKNRLMISHECTKAVDPLLKLISIADYISYFSGVVVFFLAASVT